MPICNHNDERRWAIVNPALHFNGDLPEVSDWRIEYNQALRDRDYNRAERIRAQNTISDECFGGAHADCPIPETCSCQHHQATKFPLEQPALRSLSEVQAERNNG